MRTGKSALTTICRHMQNGDKNGRVNANRTCASANYGIRANPYCNVIIVLELQLFFTAKNVAKYRNAR